MCVQDNTTYLNGKTNGKVHKILANKDVDIDYTLGQCKYKDMF